MNRAPLLEIYNAEAFTPFFSFLFESRRLSILNQLFNLVPTGTQTSANPPDSIHNLMTTYAAHLVNPILLASALAIHLKTPSGAPWFFDAWFAGTAVEDTELNLLDLESAVPQESISTVAEMTLELLDQMCATVLRNMKASRSLYSARDNSALKAWKTFNQIKDGDDNFSLRYEVMWESWFSANPFMYFIEDQSNYLPPWLRIQGRERHLISDDILWQHGFKVNSSHHNYREKMDWLLNEKKKSVNNGLANAPAEQKKTMLRELRTRQKLFERAKLFYVFNPTEIDAHAVEGLVRQELRELDENNSKPATSKDTTGEGFLADNGPLQP
jgi:hypothetical protein